MKKLSRVSILLMALTTSSVIGGFYNANFDHEIKSVSNEIEPVETEFGSDDIYLNITSVMFEETNDLHITLKYTIQTYDGTTVDETFISNEIFGAELLIMENGSTDFYGEGMVENIYLDPYVLVPEENSDLGNGEIYNLDLNDRDEIGNDRYDRGATYDAYIVWHEYDTGNDVLYNTSPRPFTTPVSDFPGYTMNTVLSGATQSIIYFEVVYDEELIVSDYDVESFFKNLRLTWNNKIGEFNSDVMDDIIGDPYAYENIWLDWDSDNHKFRYYVIVDDVDTGSYEATYAFQYNSTNYGTNKLVTNFDSPEVYSAGNLYKNNPVVDFTTYTEDEIPDHVLNDLADYERVYIKPTVDYNNQWIIDANGKGIDLSAIPNEQKKQLELNAANAILDINISDIKTVGGDEVKDCQITNDVVVNDYGQDLDPIIIDGLTPGTDYTAKMTTTLNNELFVDPIIEQTLSFSTPDTLSPPVLTYTGDDDLDSTAGENWSSDVLHFNLQPGTGWVFGDDLIKPEDLFDWGFIQIWYLDDEGYPQMTEIDFDEDQLRKIKQGDNELKLNNLQSNEMYEFSYNLGYSSEASGLFNTTYVNGSGFFSTRNKVVAPKVDFVGATKDPSDLTKTKLQFNISDPNLDGVLHHTESPDVVDPLTLTEIAESLSITEIYEMEDDGVGGYKLTPADYIEADSIGKGNLVWDSENYITLSNVKPDTNYQFTATLDYNDIATNVDHGWVSDLDNDGVQVITAEFGVGEKYSSFKNEVVITTEPFELTNSDKWQIGFDITAPIGDPSKGEPGVMVDEIDSEVHYYVSEFGGANIVKDGIITQSDWDTTSGVAKYSVVVDNLKPNTSYQIYTESTFDSTYSYGINEASENFTTGLNSSFSNSLIEAEFGFTESDLIETNNRYSDVYVDVKLKDNYLESIPENDKDDIQDMINGYQYIELIDPDGNIISQNTSLPTTTQNRMFTLEGDYKPGSTLSGYEIRIINDSSSYEESAETCSIPSFTLPYLNPTEVSFENEVISATKVDYDLKFTNYNNINDASIYIYEDLTPGVKGHGAGTRVYNEKINPYWFNDSVGAVGYDKVYKTNIEEGQLKSKTNYEIVVEGTYKDVVEENAFSMTDDTYFYHEFTTIDKGVAKFNKKSVTSTVDSITLNYSWRDNNHENEMIDYVDFTLYSVHDDGIIATESKSINDDSGDWFVTFSNLEAGIDYRIEWNVVYKDTSYNTSSEAFINTKDKYNGFSSAIELSKETENSVKVKYDYSGLNKVENRENAAVTDISLRLIDNELPSDSNMIAETDDFVNTLEEGSSLVEYVIEDENIKPEHSYSLVEDVTFSTYDYDNITDEKIYDTRTQAVNIDIIYDDSKFESSLEMIDDNTLKVDVRLDDVDQFIKNEQSIQLTLLSEGKPVDFILNDILYYDNSTFNLTYKNLMPYIIEEESTEDSILFEFILNGVTVGEGKEIELIANYNNKSFGSTVMQDKKPLVDANSMKALERFEYGSGYFVYSISIDADDSVDLENDISFTKSNSTIIDENIRVLNEELLSSYELVDEYNPENLYIRVPSSYVKSTDWRDLSFMVNRNIIVGQEVRINWAAQKMYHISDFGKIPMPKEPLSFFQVLLIILLTILLVLIIWVIIYKLLKYYSRDKWYKYATDKADLHYDMHKENMLMYGWTHKYNEYESLNNMTIPQLREYAKMMDIPIPYKLNKKEMVEILSLLNETELSRINDYSEYEFIIEEKVRDKLIDEFQEDKNIPRWMRRRYQYFTDRQNRMHSEDYKKSFKDWFADFYELFDKWFIKGTDWVLLAVGLKEKKVTKVNPEDYDWEQHSTELELVHEGEISDTEEISTVTSGGDSND